MTAKEQESIRHTVMACMAGVHQGLTHLLDYGEPVHELHHQATALKRKMEKEFGHDEA